MTFCISDEVRRQVTLVKQHSFGEIKFNSESVAFFNSYNAVFADLVDGISDDIADCRVSSRNGCNAGDLSFVFDFLRQLLDAFDSSSNGLFDALLETHRVCTSSHVAQTEVHHCLCKHGGGGGAVTGNIVGLGSNFFD